MLRHYDHKNLFQIVLRNVTINKWEILILTSEYFIFALRYLKDIVLLVNMQSQNIFFRLL